MERLWATVMVVVCAGCGYLDEELFLDERQLEAAEAMEMEGMSVFGTYSTSCGGYGYARSSRRALVGHAEVAAAVSEDALADQAATVGIGRVDASSTSTTRRQQSRTLSLPAELYYESLAARNDSIATEYAR